MALFVSRAAYERERQRAAMAEDRMITLDAAGRTTALEVHQLATRLADAQANIAREQQQAASAVARADKAEERADYLLKQLIALKKKGYEIAPESRPGRVVPPKLDGEAAALQRVHDAVIENIAHDIEQMPGIPKEVALAEAQRLRNAALGDGTML